MATLKSQYGGLKDSLLRYWRAYGGWRAFWTSPILHVSLILNIGCYAYWFDRSWQPLTLSLLPSILGFSLGTYALVFSLLTSKIKIALKELKTESGASFLDELNSLFMHFLVTQVVSIIFAILYSATLIHDVIMMISGDPLFSESAITFLAPIGGAVGCLLLIYAVLSVATAALVVYRLAAVVEPE